MRIFNYKRELFFRRSVFRNRRYLFGDIGNSFELEVDGRSLIEDINRFRPDAILILNIASYAAGTNPWRGRFDKCWCAGSRSHDERFHSQSCCDGFLEIIGLKHFELAQIQLGRRAQRIAQGSIS